MKLNTLKFKYHFIKCNYSVTIIYMHFFIYATNYIINKYLVILSYAIYYIILY